MPKKKAPPPSPEALADAAELRAAAARLDAVAPANDADLPLAVLQKEVRACEIIVRRGYDLTQGFIPTDLRGIAEYITEVEPQ